MAEKVFTPEQVKNLQEFQTSDCFHPFTCGGDHSKDDCSPDLIPTEEGWICPDDNCDYTQKTAYSFMMDGSWKNTVNYKIAKAKTHEERMKIFEEFQEKSE